MFSTSIHVFDFEFHVFDFDFYIFDFKFPVFDFDFYIFDFKFEIFDFDCKNIRLRVKYSSYFCPQRNAIRDQYKYKNCSQTSKYFRQCTYPQLCSNSYSILSVQGRKTKNFAERLACVRLEAAAFTEKNPSIPGLVTKKP